ncbi:hypothetical protein [Geomonas subterranea]|uniref:hypothetical protein n=1 Tax=Geomonas subterranea TaxID=2847989 RepID=UPI001CD7D52B|nr:hypothetical protein [Geomonas fuzhouensis]
MAKITTLVLLFFLTISATGTIFAADFAAVSTWSTVRHPASTPENTVGHPANIREVVREDPIVTKLRTAPPGTIGFNPPPHMKFYKWNDFQVGVSPKRLTRETVSELKSKFRRKTFFQYTSVQHVTTKMRFELTGEHPDDCEIQPVGAVDLDTAQVSTQNFSVRPLKLGNLTLYLKVKAVIFDDRSNDKVHVEYEELNRKIEVLVISTGTFVYMMDLVKQYDSIVLPIILSLPFWFRRVRARLRALWDIVVSSK